MAPPSTRARGQLLEAAVMVALAFVFAAIFVLTAMLV
jgi:hypothetical protein